MTCDTVCIHCRGRIGPILANQNSEVPNSNCSLVCSSFILRDKRPVGIRNQRSWDSQHFLNLSQLPGNPAQHFHSKVRGSRKNFKRVRTTNGWRKQLRFFLVSWQAVYLFLGLCLLLLPIPTMSNPVPSTSGESSRSSSSGLNNNGDTPSSTPHHRHSRTHEREQKWINPCRIPSTLPTLSGDNELIQTQSDEDVFHNIIVQAHKAETQALEFFKNFYREAFGGDPEESDRYERLTYDFLTDVMDQVNNQLTDEHFSTLQVDETIRLMYQGLQKFAVGLEAIVLDQACYGGSFYHHFNEAEFQLKYVLCELQIAMLEKNISHNDITREIMKTEYRDLADKTTRYIRDWTIFRDYVKTLRYVRHAFQYFRNRVISARETQNPA